MKRRKVRLFTCWPTRYAKRTCIAYEEGRKAAYVAFCGEFRRRVERFMESFNPPLEDFELLLL